MTRLREPLIHRLRDDRGDVPGWVLMSNTMIGAYDDRCYLPAHFP